ncbi:agmatine deiminase family protein [Pannonibacter sp. SL95]|uniref:agmatine deiminase family protein n=1 Tax=Pannonibacter sp. SL95 TaxID=2995153 RepID=UPI0022748D60|nr:agmatine deiminase family protein [Pannonibacter sp. SL95]MCY1704894.1 agmatine deiminase family protein [Pannonibacter sp. SL95]
MASSVQRLHVPAEEAPHQATLMQWPASRKVHTDPVFLLMLQETIADIANAISEFEPVYMLADASLHGSARKLLSATVELWDIPTEDLWCRDSGPLFARTATGRPVISHIAFNGWGNRQLHVKDGQIARRVGERLGVPLVDSGLIGEAGGVEHDGHGLLLAHESCWVHDNRNPCLSRDDIEQRLLAAYGADRMIWSAGVKDQDITDYHIDSLARLTGPGRVLINLPDHPDPRDAFHKAALATHSALGSAGLSIDVIPEPNRRRVKSDDFVASYVNFFVCNGAVIAPEFGDPETDAVAHDALSRHYPGRGIIMLNTDALGEIGGGIHCATQQVPAA